MNPAPGIYLPDNPALTALLATLPHPDQAALLVYFVGVKKWQDDLDHGFARLNDAILRGYIHPRDLGPLKRLLVACGVLRTAPYSVGHFATGFQIAAPFNGPPRRYMLTDATLAAKVQAYRQRDRIAGTDGDVQAVVDRRRPLLDHQRNSLTALSLPADPAELIKALPQANPDHVAYVSLCIAHQDHDGITVDAFGWRLHSLITRTSHHLRPLLLLDGRLTAEVDVTNSQPLLLAILVRHKELWNDIMEGQPPALLPGPSSPVPALSYVANRRETDDFLAVCETGNLYDDLAKEASLVRDQAKHQLFRDVLFGKAHVAGPLTRAFGRRWPSILNAIRQAKIQHGYKSVAKALQRLESCIMLDGVGCRLVREFPDLPFLTIHDSALLVADRTEQVQAIMREEFARWGAAATIHIKPTGAAGRTEEPGLAPPGPRTVR